VEYVFHLAALPRVQPSIENPILYHDVNVNGMLNILVAARDAGVKKVIYSASSAAYGDQKEIPVHEEVKPNPMSPYALHKYIGELKVKLFHDIYGVPTVSLRYFNVYGKRQPIEGAYTLVMGIFARQRLANEPLTIVGDGEQRRDYVSVVDVVRANIMAAESEKAGKGEVINIGVGNNYSVNEVAQMMGGEVVHIEPRIEPRETLADNRRAKELLGWEPTVDLSEWIKEYKQELGIK
jgi:UDP-glucose 4-epimerase